MRYKFANGILLNENSKFAPYMYAGFSINHLADRMKKNCVNVGSYMVINTGIGFRYNFNERLYAGYNLGVGSFQSDKLDRMDKEEADMSIQNTLFLGIDLF